MTSSRKSTRPSTKKSSPEKSFSLISDGTFRRMYAAMLGCRLLEEQGQRELRKRSKKSRSIAPSSVKPSTGKEAVLVGATLELRADDTITAPSGEVIFREPNKKAVGKTAQAQQALIESRRSVFAFAASTGAQLTIGTGVALAHKDSANTAGDGRIVVAFGDANPESMGSWKEALHLAGAHQLPLLFVLLPDASNDLTVSAICEQAALSGVTAIPVDATDVVAIYRVSFESIARARRGTGATLIVARHFLVDGKAASSRPEFIDPIKRLEDYLSTKGLFTAKWKAESRRQSK